MYIDSHAHYDSCFEKGISENELMNSVAESLYCSVHVATEADTFEWAREFSYKYDNILFSAGIHPSSPFSDQDLNYLTQFVADCIQKKEKLFGIGETGLDYHWMEHSKESQRILFEYQLDLARQYNLPVIIHNRDAHEDTLAILRNCGYTNVIIHCFSGDKDTAAAFLDFGALISFAGNVTFKKATMLQESLLYVPFERLLLETDCPYLTPVPFRGTTNRPDYVRHVYEFVSLHKDIEITQLQKIIINNFEAVSPVKVNNEKLRT
ncbi:MAG: TatD family hydrolase [Spirochaetes bacterium]|nr:TatD family hydrolase [Spirochaetota bacterium]